MRGEWNGRRGNILQDERSTSTIIVVSRKILVNNIYTIYIQQQKQWLFGLEITDTAILFLEKLVVFISSSKKISFFKQVRNTAFKKLFIEKKVNTDDVKGRERQRERSFAQVQVHRARKDRFGEGLRERGDRVDQEEQKR